MPSTFNARNAAAYEQAMGRWSRRLAEPFLAFAGNPEGGRVLEVGCGTGSLTARLLDMGGLARLDAIDVSDAYVTHARERFDDSRLVVHRADAGDLPFADDSFDLSVSLLAFHLMTHPDMALRELIRTTRSGGMIAAAVWDVVGGLPHARLFLDTAALFDEAGSAMRARYLAVPLTRSGELAALWSAAGLREVEQAAATVRFDFAEFDDYWGAFLNGEGTMGGYVAGLEPARRDALGLRIRAAYEGGSGDGPRSFAATAWMCRGRVADAGAPSLLA